VTSPRSRAEQTDEPPSIDVELDLVQRITRRRRATGRGPLDAGVVTRTPRGAQDATRQRGEQASPAARPH